MQWLGWFWVPHELGNLHTLRCTPTNSWGHHCVESDWSCWWPQLQVVEGVFSDEDIDMSLDPWAAEWCLERRISSQIKQSPMKVAESKSCAIHSVAWMWLFDAPSGQNNMEIWKCLGFQALTLSSLIYQNSIGTSGELIHYDPLAFVIQSHPVAPTSLMKSLRLMVEILMWMLRESRKKSPCFDAYFS